MNFRPLAMCIQRFVYKTVKGLHIVVAFLDVLSPCDIHYYSRSIYAATHTMLVTR